MNIPTDTPIYAFIKRDLKRQIDSGELPEGARVPSEFELARTYSVSRNPTRQALRDLELEGYLVRHPGRGSFVASAERRTRTAQQRELNAIALSLPPFESPQSRLIMQGFVEGAAANGYHAVICLPQRETESVASDVRQLRAGGVRGLVIYPSGAEAGAGTWLVSLQKDHFPIVLLEHRISGVEADFVSHDHEMLAHDVTHALVQRGCRRIGMVLSGGDTEVTVERLAGYRRALAETGCLLEQGLVIRVPHPAQSAFVLTERLWTDVEMPDGIVSDSALVAEALAQHLAGGGIPIAALEEDSHFSSEATSVAGSRQARLIGWESARLLINRIKYPELPVQSVVFKAGARTEMGTPAGTKA